MSRSPRTAGTFPQVGIGVEQIYQTTTIPTAPASSFANANVVSQLTLTGSRRMGRWPGVPPSVRRWEFSSSARNA